MDKQAILLWCRQALRLHDHEALHAACQTGRPVIPVYVFDPHEWDGRIEDFPKTGAIRKRFLEESVLAFREALAAAGSGLLLAHGRPREVLPQLARAWGASEIYATAAAAHDERQEEVALAAAFPLRLFWGHTLIHLHDLPFPIDSLPNVFTQARQLIERHSPVRPCLPAPEAIRSPELPQSPMPGLWGAQGPPPHNPGACLPFKGGEQEALARLRHYIWGTRAIASYKETRNGLLGADYSSKFSPWLAAGCLSPRTIYEEVKRFEREDVANESTYWMVFELLWRDYFHWVALLHGKRLFGKLGLKRRSGLAFGRAPGVLERWRLGQTGEPFVDANMRELLHTGFMSNRGRQNAASFLVKDLGGDWRWGAAWFESQLIDYDPCSNYGNWLYVAGLGNDPREQRYFNVRKQAAQYDPEGEYQRHWLGKD